MQPQALARACGLPAGPRAARPLKRIRADSVHLNAPSNEIIYGSGLP
ncbi:hypothetical protein BH24ACT5_BH24ACT5_30820 [soil metagenome]